jgi:hypothetical protein
MDDYKLCDEYYNFVVKNEFKNIIPAVLYPLVNDEEISISYKYRALYDTYAQERFYSDCVVVLDVVNSDKQELLKTLSMFSSKVLVLSSKLLNQEDVHYLKTLYCEVDVVSSFVIAKGKINDIIPISNKPYKDGNRGPDARRQSRMVKELIKSNN